MPQARDPRKRCVAVIQSNYVPWKGYFDIIHDADLFIFYDDVQYSKNSWRNRNRIKTPQGAAWLAVPVRSRLGQKIRDVELTDGRGAEKHWKTLQQLYSPAPHFERYRAFLEATYLGSRWQRLSELNQHMTISIAREFLGITTEFRDSSEFALHGTKT